MADEPLWKVHDQARRLAELTADAAELKEAPLRHDVRSLGRLLGEVIREQEGDAIFAAVEELRHLAIRHREIEGDRVSPPAGPDDEPMRRAEQRVDAMAVADAYRLTRAFAIYFELTNLAETNHRKRRRRATALHADQAPQPGTFRGTLIRLRDAGLDLPAVLQQLARVSVVPVFTAHPTEV